MGYCLYDCCLCHGEKQGYKVSEKISWKDRLFLTLDALPSLFLIVVVIGGIVGGILQQQKVQRSQFYIL